VTVEEMTFQASMMIGRDLGELGRAADQLRGWLADVLDDDAAAAVELALVEALTNSIQHGPSDSEKPISVHLNVSDADVVVEIGDGSPPMPTLFENAGQQKLDLDSLELDNLAEGGRGLSLIVLSMDEVSYVQTEDQVRLRMVRHRR
jgi:anti-sigma regulatory factor (Ser/Thr protein kinase)